MSDDESTWAEALAEAMQQAGDQGPVLAMAPDEAAFSVPFDAGYGLSAGPPVLAWTADRVYFPVVYDGAEWLESAPRNPSTDGQGHAGGQ